MTKTALSRRAPWLAALAFMTLGAPTQAAVFCVNSAGTLKTALTTAASNGADDEIRIIQGTYVGNFVYASTQANKLSVLGGYAAGCGSRILNPVNTVLDGNQVNSVLALSAPNQAAEFLVEGLTLRNGKRTTGTKTGGGLYVLTSDKGAVTVRRNRVEKNTASSGGGAYIAGGYAAGVYSGIITITLANNTFSDNNGGGVDVSSSYTATITLTNNSFSGNNGGGAHILSGYRGTTKLINNNFLGNNGGGAHFYEFAGTVTIINNNFSGNRSETGCGGGIVIPREIDGANSAVTLINNRFSDNSSVCPGGGAYVYASTMTLTNNSFSDNTGTDGGGAYADASTLTLTNNSIVGNQSKTGAGLSLYPGRDEATNSAALYNNLFWNNVATDNQGADLKIENDSDGDYLPTPIKLFGNSFDRSAAGFQITIPVTIHSSNLNGLDPLFVDAAKGDLHLLPDSPMINAGYAQTPNLPETDFEGDPRVLGGRVDIGADEFDDSSADAPDFRVTKLVLTPASPSANGTFSATATVTNAGTLAGVPGTLQVWANQAAERACGSVGNKAAVISTALTPGQSTEVTLSGLSAGAGGAKTLRAFIDSRCQTTEASETNNQLTKAYTVKPPAPDFVVTNIALTPASPKVKGTFSVAVTVKNQGAASGDAGYLDVWLNQPTAVKCGADGNAWASIGKLDPGKSRTVTLTGLRGGAAGRKTLRAFADSWCETREANDANNQRGQTYSVAP